MRTWIRVLDRRIKMEIYNIYHTNKNIKDEDEKREWGRIKIILKFIVLVTESMPVLLAKQEKGGVESGIWEGICWIWDVSRLYPK